MNRAIRGEWSKVVPSRAPGDSVAFVFRLAAGERLAVDTGATETVLRSSTLVADLQHGDIFDGTFTWPFDIFDVRLQISPKAGGLNLLRASGSVFARSLNSPSSWHRHMLVVNQRFDYMNNRAFKFGAQSVEVGIASRWSLTRGFAVRTDVFADAVILGALDAPASGSGERDYDFGPGAGLRLDASLERDGITYLSFLGRSEYVHSVSGAAADHIAAFGGFEAVLPVARGIGLAGHFRYFNRRSRYADGTVDDREYPEVRLMLLWTLAARPSGLGIR
jgi:hypothetical protein